VKTINPETQLDSSAPTKKTASSKHIFLAGFLTGGSVVAIIIPICVWLFVGPIEQDGASTALTEPVEQTEIVPAAYDEAQIREWINKLDVEIDEYRTKLTTSDQKLSEAKRYYRVLRNVKNVPVDDPRCIFHFDNAKAWYNAVVQLRAEIDQRQEWKEDLQYKLERMKLEGMIAAGPNDSQLISQIKSSVGAAAFVNSDKFLEYDTGSVVDPDQFMMGD